MGQAVLILVFALAVLALYGTWNGTLIPALYQLTGKKSG